MICMDPLCLNPLCMGRHEHVPTPAPTDETEVPTLEGLGEWIDAVVPVVTADADGVVTLEAIEKARAELPKPPRVQLILREEDRPALVTFLRENLGDSPFGGVEVLYNGGLRPGFVVGVIEWGDKPIDIFTFRLYEDVSGSPE